MDKSNVSQKSKLPPPESSETESGSSDEETEDEEQAESTVKATGSPAKRTRESNGRKEKDDEPPSKKKKPEVTTPAPKATPKPSDRKSLTKAERGKPTPPAKEKPSKEPAAEKDKKSSKKKSQSPAAAKPTTSNKSDDETPRKPNNSRPWLPDEELALSRELQKDRLYNTYGTSLPSSRADPYWEKLMGKLSFMDKYEKEQRIERLCEKVRRMRLRYESLNTRLKAGETSVYKNPHEGTLWRIWHTIWGPNKATPGMLNGDDDEEEEEEEEEEEDGSDDNESEEEEEEEIVPTQAKGRQAAVGRVAAQKKAVSKKVAESSSEDDESNKEESPVKATPPAVLTAPAAPAAPAAPSIPAIVPAKGPVPTAMDVDVNTSGKNNLLRGVVHNGAHGGHAIVPAFEKSVRVDALPKVTDELRAENLALLRDMRGTCVKMVDEAKTQSLLLCERMLEETCVKTTEIVEEARVKSAQILEELRLVVKELGTIAGLNGRNGANGGRWNDFSDNPFQGTGLLGSGASPLGESNSLDSKWREQTEAEQGLLLQRLQLVQEQARIQQEGIRLKLNIQKQQALAKDQA